MIILLAYFEQEHDQSQTAVTGRVIPKGILLRNLIQRQCDGDVVGKLSRLIYVARLIVAVRDLKRVPCVAY